MICHNAEVKRRHVEVTRRHDELTRRHAEFISVSVFVASSNEILKQVQDDGVGQDNGIFSLAEQLLKAP
ncbi:hypothetical protein H4J56_11250 [Colwellia sp. BRX8-4]|uniref:hypothetical protein n=1 Tax=Colwellia sp. BRX8-4 TaxID=2759836 RepID=UPI0015F6FC10|nr:hypothetical protein [Colwellia sp. BRX8-4]MBA6364083.1 hypothetical protein [Colwellia sp. BRX8-8]MBA6371999.1 hypothetical protein [Colwellia sp. BRX8-4]